MLQLQHLLSISEDMIVINEMLVIAVIKMTVCCCCRQSYDVEISVAVPGTTMKSCNVLDLKNPFFRYTGQQPQPPPGNNHTSPSEAYWNQHDLAAG